MSSSTSPSTNSASPDLAGIINAAAPGRTSRLRLALIIGGVVILALVWFGWHRARAARAAAPVFVTAPLTRGDISLTITATGNLEPTNEVTVGSELSGTALEVYVDTNDRVTKGQPLAKLDTTKLNQQIAVSTANLQSAQASVAQAEATVTETEATLTRLTELRRLSGGKLPSSTEFDTAVAASARAQANLLVAQASVAQAEANLRINQNDLSKAIIKSPIDGIVLTRDIEPGQTVAASFTAPELFVIAENLEHMKLIVTVAEADIARLREGQAATFTVDAWPERTYDATVTKVAYGSSVTDNVVTYETELEVANTDLTLRPGMTATADVKVAESNDVLLAPVAALRFTPATPAAGAAPQKTFIQSLTPMPPRRTASGAPGAEPAGAAKASPTLWVLRDGQPESIAVKTGLNDGRHVEVSAAGLSADTAVITRTATAQP